MLNALRATFAPASKAAAARPADAALRPLPRAGGPAPAGVDAAAAQRALTLIDISKRFGAIDALRGVSLALGEGELVAVTGPSGAGKSTLGRLVSGLETASAGRLELGGQPFGELPPQQRHVAHMFESFALYPTRTVRANIASPLAAPSNRGRWSAAQAAERIDEVLALTEMTALAGRLPAQLSGGQKQRVALCRALVQDPSVFVLDEPIGHLDAKLRHRLRGELRRRQRGQRAGTLWLTPDGLEAMAVADRLLVLIGGVAQQLDTPEAVHARPANVSVARLIGDPALNVLPLRLHVDGGTQVVVGEAGAAPLPASPALGRLLAAYPTGGRLQLGLRPSAIVVRPASTSNLSAGATDSLPAQLYALEPLGQHSIVTVEIGGVRVRSRQRGMAAGRPGEPVRLDFDAAEALAFHPDSGVLLG